jgi:hypothetical protein
MRLREEAQRERKMPIRQYTGEGVFTPQAVSAMSRALEEATRILGIEDDEERQIVARFIIQLSREDDSLDAAGLRDGVFAALGGITSSATISTSPQRSNPHAGPLNELS